MVLPPVQFFPTQKMVQACKHAWEGNRPFVANLVHFLVFPTYQGPKGTQYGLDGWGMPLEPQNPYPLKKGEKNL